MNRKTFVIYGIRSVLNKPHHTIIDIRAKGTKHLPKDDLLADPYDIPKM